MFVKHEAKFLSVGITLELKENIEDLCKRDIVKYHLMRKIFI